MDVNAQHMAYELGMQASMSTCSVDCAVSIEYTIQREVFFRRNGEYAFVQDLEKLIAQLTELKDYIGRSMPWDESTSF